MTKQPKPDAAAPAVPETEDPAAVAAAEPGKAGAEVDHPPQGGIRPGRRRGPDAPGVTLVVTARQPERWRAARKFGPTPVLIPASELTEAQIAALHGDPLLVVVTA